MAPVLTQCVLVVDDYGLKTVQEYMYHIRNNAESSVRNLLKDVARRAGTNTLEAVDYLDDGSPVSECHRLLKFSSEFKQYCRSNSRLTSMRPMDRPISISPGRAVKSEAI